MPNVLDGNGLQIQTLAEIIAEILDGAAGFAGLREIYGADINVDPNSPDGQMVNLYAQGKLDALELLQTIYDSFDPDQAFGVNLDQRCAINGVVREPGTFTQVIVTVTVTQALTLVGLDESLTPFTVSDSSGNQFQLLATNVFSSSGSADLAFQSSVIGSVVVVANTITNIVTTQLGVSGVNNGSVATSVGTNEESDYSLRIRRANSTANPSQGYYQGLIGGLIDITGVLQAIVLENDSSTTDSNGIPGHSIWIIVNAPSSLNAQIGQQIYVHRNAGVGWKNGGTGATAHATRSGSTIATVVVDTGGANYTNAPAVSFVGGGGSGAAAHAVLTNGVVTSVVVDAPGTGYSTPPTIVFNPETNLVPINQIDDTIFDVYFDNPTPEPLWISFSVTAITGSVDPIFIRNQILALLSYNINQPADTTSIVALIKQISPNASVSLEGVSSDNITYVNLLQPISVNYQFTLATARIIINGTPG